MIIILLVILTYRYNREDFMVVLLIGGRHTANTPIGVGDLNGGRSL